MALLAIGTSLAGGTASAQTAQAAPAVQTAPAGLDRSLPRPWGVDLRGATATQAWLALETIEQPTVRRYNGVLDLATGCVTESTPGFDRIDKLGESTRDMWAAPSRTNSAAARTQRAVAGLADPATQDEIRRLVAFGNRFGVQQVGDWAWSPDGQKVLTTVAETAFRSRDGGKTFERLDQNQSRYAHVTRDGKWGFYERCSNADIREYSCKPEWRQAVVLSLDDPSAAPRIVPLDAGRIRGLDPSGMKLLVVKDNEPKKVTGWHLDPSTATLTRAYAVDAPVLPQNKFYDLDPSRGGAFGIFDTVEHPATTVNVVSLTDGHRVRSMRNTRVLTTSVDDEGRLAWATYNTVDVFTLTSAGTRRIGAGDVVGWAPGGRLITYETPKPPANHPVGKMVPQPPGTLGDVACKLVHVKTIPL